MEVRTGALALVLAALLMSPAAAVSPLATDTHAAPQPIGAAAAFTRGDPLPAWALPFAPMPASEHREPVVLRVAETQIHVGDSPQQTAYLVQRALQVNDAAALDRIGQYALYFVPQYQRIRLHALTLHRDGQAMDRTADVRLRFLEREQQLERGISSGMVTALLMLDDVRVGDTLRLVYTLEGRNPVLGARYGHSLAWDHEEPVALRRATLIAPAGRDIAWRLQGDHRPTTLQPQRLSAPGAPLQVLRFEERDIEPLEEEAAVPERYLAARFLQLTEFADWQSVAQWAGALFPADTPLPPSLQPLLAQWQAIDDPLQRAGAALRWVQEEIRYLSVALGESSHRPALPAEVVSRRWGDCKDKTLLLVTLLRALGLEADPVLVASQSPQLPPRLLPHPDAFDHVVAQLRVHGLVYTLDPTRLGQRGRLERLGVLEGASALVVRPDTQALATLQSHDPLALGTRELEEHFVVPALGGAGTLLTRQTWHGGDAELMRLAFARMGAEPRRRQVLSGYERRYPGARLRGEPRVLDDSDGNALTLEAELDIPQLTRLQGGRWLLRFVPEPLAALQAPEAGERRFPATVARLPYRGVYRLSVQWPEAVSLLQPGELQRVPSDFFAAEVQRSFRARRSELQASLTPRVAEVAPARLPALAADLQRLQQAVAGVVAVEAETLARPGVLAFGRRSLADSTDARLQRQVQRNTWAIEGGQLAGEDLADALCARADALAERGQAAAGLDDARRAVQEAPVHGPAQACLGRALFAAGRFADAVPAWTRALTLGEDAGAALYQRGHARFYAGDLGAAAADFGKAAQLLARADHPVQTTHAQLWQAWALKRAGQPLPADWQAPRPADDLPWPRPALALAGGTLAPEQLIAQIEHGGLQGDALQLALAEAWFHLGQHYRAAGDAAKARQAFEHVRSRSLPAALEHRAAGFELAAPALSAPPAARSATQSYR